MKSQLKLLVSLCCLLSSLACEEAYEVETQDGVGPTRNVLGGDLVSKDESSQFNNAVVGLDANGGHHSHGSGILVAPRLVLTNEHCGGHCNWGTTGGEDTVEFGHNSATGLRDEQVSVVEELDYPMDPDVGETCVPGRGSNHDIGLWVLSHPPRTALPYWRPAPLDGIDQPLELYGFGAQDTASASVAKDHPSYAAAAGPLRKAECSSTDTGWDTRWVTYLEDGSDEGNYPVFKTNSVGAYWFESECTDDDGNWARSEGGDSGGPIFDKDGFQVGVNKSHSSDFDNRNGNDSGAMHLANYADWVEKWIEIFSTKLHLGDFNGDGVVDMLDYNSQGKVSWIDYSAENLSTGKIELSITDDTYRFNWCRGELNLGDFDGDGHTDMLCVDQNRNLTSIAFAANYGFPASHFRWSGPDGDDVICSGDLVVGDFDGDSDDDIWCRGDSGLRKVYMSSGDRTTLFPTTPSWSARDSWCGQELYVGDFDGNGQDDILCRNPGKAMYLRLSISSKDSYRYTARARSTRWCGQQLIVAQVGDLPGDGRDGDDLICFDQSRQRMWITYSYWDYPETTFTFDFDNDAYVKFASGFCAGDDDSLYAADADEGGSNGDRDDLICHNARSGQARVVLNRGGSTPYGSFYERTLPPVADVLEESPSFPIIGPIFF